MKPTITLLLLAPVVFCSCLNPEKYEDVTTPPPKDVTVAVDTTQDSSTQDAALEISSVDIVPDLDASEPTDDGTQQDVDLVLVDADVPVEDLAQPPDDLSQSEVCMCTFESAITNPSAQISVLLTGDFFTPEWPTSADDGALSLTVVGGLWSGQFELTQGQVVEYKFLVEWPGEPLQWCIYDGSWDCDPALGNQVLVVNCGTGACGVAQ